MGVLISADGKYKYTGIVLKPKIFSELMIYLLDGKQFTRQQAIDIVQRFHEEHGGNPPESDYTGCFKKACNYLKGMLENPAQGTWRLSYKIESVKPIVQKAEERIDVPKAEKCIGEGTEHVYVYYYPLYKKFADENKQKHFPCKVGMTERKVFDRIFGQCGTAYPEYPVIALDISCEDARKLESALHAVLDYQRKHLDHAPGTEWYFTNPEEVESIFTMIHE